MSSNAEKRKHPSSELLRLIEDWLKWDQCEVTRQEIEQFQNEKKWDDLEARLCHRIQFGTAGLRAKMGSGFALMNELTVIQATQGLLRQLELSFPSKKKEESLSVVIGFDARHQSHRFARLAASLFCHEHIHVYLFDSDVVPTPFIPFSVRELGCQAGLMITASHNPKDDNGYKVYWENGAQIISPLDVEISEQISSNLQPWKDKAWNLSSLQSSWMSDPLERIFVEYMSRLSSLSSFVDLNRSSDLKFVYTPVHGVGQRYAEEAFRRFHLSPFISVDEQKDPDPNFSTVKYPNPEEGKETLECAIQTANREKADFILATDPDADRFALAERDANNDQQWKILSGNQLGSLLGWWKWFTWRNRNPHVDLRDVFMLYSTVSSHILQSIAEVEGFQTIETLTGFKWLGNRADQLIKEKKHVLFAFEEAIGFMCDPLNVLDKDGISALVLGAEMCVYLHSIGRTLMDQLHQLSLLYGFHLNNNSYVLCPKTDLLLNIFHRLRHFDEQEDSSPEKSSRAHQSERKEGDVLVQYSNKLKSHLSVNEDQKKEKEKTYVYPRRSGPFEIISIRDLTVGIEADFRSNGKDKKPSLPCSSATEMLTFELSNGCSITIRASGTEPKIKWYSEIRKKKNNEQIDDQTFEEQTKEELNRVVEQIVEEFLQPKINGLIEH